MLRRLGASVSVLALLVGFVAAPQTHLHSPGDNAPADAWHALDASLFHAHLTSHQDEHSHGEPADSCDDHGTGLRSFEGFVFQVVAGLHCPAATLLTDAPAPVRVPDTRLDVHNLQPRAHSPPPTLQPSLRAPPASRHAVA